MVEHFKWLLKDEEIEFEKKKFRGKLAGKAYIYSKNLDGIIRTRIIIFAMSILVLYRVLANYLFYEIFDMQFLIERVVFSIIILMAGLLFNKARVFSILIAVIPLIIIVSIYIFIPGQFHLRSVAFMLAIIIIILTGIYNNMKSKRLKKELERTMIESNLVEE